MAELSPAAQAVLDAIKSELDHAPWDLSFIAGSSAAAALRAAADQIVIKLAGFGQESAWYLKEIATELEAQ
jgi:hypothetical protein